MCNLDQSTITLVRKIRKVASRGKRLGSRRDDEDFELRKRKLNCEAPFVLIKIVFLQFLTHLLPKCIFFRFNGVLTWVLGQKLGRIFNLW